MDDRLIEHGHSRLRFRQYIRPEATVICVGSSVRDYLSLRVHRCFHQPEQCMPSLCPSRSTETAAVLPFCLQRHSRNVACVVWRTGRRRSRCEVAGCTSRHSCSSQFRTASSVTTSSCRNRLLLMSDDVPISVQYLTSRCRSTLVTVFP